MNQLRNQKYFVIATAGHVDHGKSAIVKALTGTDPDRLPEEKSRQITIDLGFAHLELTASASDQDIDKTTFSISIIDVPGHEDFVRNMIAGIGSIDMALLVVAADDGWMPQSEEHLQILSYLGIKELVVAVNKSDVVSPERAIEQIQQQLGDTRYQTAPIIPISARSGLGLDQLKTALRSTLTRILPHRDIGKTRLFIDRAFNLQGIGSVVTGTLTGGPISSGEQVFLQPGNFKTRARSLQAHRTSVSTAQPGMRVGANLAELPKGASNHDLRRGYLLTSKEFEPSATLDVLIERSPRLHRLSGAGRPIKSGTCVYLQYGTGRIPATVVFSGRNALEAGQSAISQLRLPSPILAFVGDRFVLRDRSEQHTIAGGLILDVTASPRSFRSVGQQKLLGMRIANPDDIGAYVESELIRRGPMRVQNLLPNSNFSDVEIGEALNELQKNARVIVAGDIASDVNSWRLLRQHAIDLIDRAHKTKPEQDGLALTELRRELAAVSAEAIEALIIDLCASGFIRGGSVVARASHQSRLHGPLQRTAKEILAALMEKPLDPPARARIAPDSTRQQAVRYLIEHGEIVDLGTDLLVSGEAFSRAKEVVVQFISAKGPATVSELREALRTSRRVAVPLLERLDRERVTRRLGDRRVLTAEKSSSQ
jgi:selenocysteine-specific elongation factor